MTLLEREFHCEQCGTIIYVGVSGQYLTGCEHYPTTPVYNEVELNQVIKKGTKAWSGVQINDV